MILSIISLPGPSICSAKNTSNRVVFRIVPSFWRVKPILTSSLMWRDLDGFRVLTFMLEEQSILAHKAIQVRPWDRVMSLAFLCHGFSNVLRGEPRRTLSVSPARDDHMSASLPVASLHLTSARAAPPGGLSGHLPARRQSCRVEGRTRRDDAWRSPRRTGRTRMIRRRSR